MTGARKAILSRFRACGQSSCCTGARPIFPLASRIDRPDVVHRKGNAVKPEAKWAASRSDFAKIAQFCVKKAGINPLVLRFLAWN